MSINIHGLGAHVEAVRRATRRALQGIDDYQDLLQAGGAEVGPTSTGLLVRTIGQIEDALEELGAFSSLKPPDWGCYSRRGGARRRVASCLDPVRYHRP
jgi:hypothetical protein